ncbi:rCG50206 [Rattus norvegicus]|uniref:RCG50206 n=1 Tax=Rattus norvegicus TaxID=10116 RepID=A6JZ23_RAT|nr:rCG50206 [Rattus norvegicus]
MLSIPGVLAPGDQTQGGASGLAMKQEKIW